MRRKGKEDGGRKERGRGRRERGRRENRKREWESQVGREGGGSEGRRDREEEEEEKEGKWRRTITPTHTHVAFNTVVYHTHLRLMHQRCFASWKVLQVEIRQHGTSPMRGNPFSHTSHHTPTNWQY